MADDPTPRGKPGRPRSPDNPTRVTAWVKGKEYDRLYAIAQGRDESMSATLRRVIERGLKKP